MQHREIITGVNASGVAFGFASLAGAAVIVGIRLATDWTLAIRKVALPPWSLYVAAALLVAIGIAAVVFSLDAQKCAACRRTLDPGQAYFPLELEPQVTQAVAHVDTQMLASLPMVPKNCMKMHLRIATCPNHHVGTWELWKWEDFKVADVLPAAIIKGPAVSALASLAEQHATFRGDDD